MESSDFIQSHQRELVEIGEDWIEGRENAGLAKLADLAVTFISGSVGAGKAVGDVVRKLLTSDVNAHLERQTVEWRRQLRREELVRRVTREITDVLEELLGQIVRSQIAGTERIGRGIDQMREELRSFLSSRESDHFVEVDGEHRASGVGDIIALDIQGPAIIRPGTRSIAEGVGAITATRIGGKRDDRDR